MLRLILFLVSFIATFNLTYALPAHEAFTDIDENYKYLKELQFFYDVGIINPDLNGEFNPQNLMDRDEFVWITVEVNCQRCIPPNTPASLINMYVWIHPFFDVFESNAFNHCIAYAKDHNYVRWYNIGQACDNGVVNENQAPFCVSNSITIEEALAILLRNSSIFSIHENQQLLWMITEGDITEPIGNDVFPTIDGAPYSFYGYFQKALEYSYEEYDGKTGEVTEYKLIEPDANGNLNPKKAITKEELLKMAYILIKTNACTFWDEKMDIALWIDIYDKECSEDSWCELSTLENETETEYDFDANAKWFCEEWIPPEWYIWQFFHRSSKTIESVYYGKYIDNYVFPLAWKWKIVLTAKDKCWNEATVYSTIQIKDIRGRYEGWLIVDINAIPMMGPQPLDVDIEWIVWVHEWEVTYTWEYWDGITWEGKNTNNKYYASWIYKIKLHAKDEWGNEWDATTLIKVINTDCDENCWCPPRMTCSIQWPPRCSSEWICMSDQDQDGILDVNDLCPESSWDNGRLGCPDDVDLSEVKRTKWFECKVNGDCRDDSDTTSLCLLSTSWINKCFEDNDWDWLADPNEEIDPSIVRDLCPLVPWTFPKVWCPDIIQTCWVGCLCEPWYWCTDQDTNSCTTNGKCLPLVGGPCGWDCSCEPWYTCSEQDTDTCPSSGMCVLDSAVACWDECDCEPWFTCTDKDTSTCPSDWKCIPESPNKCWDDCSCDPWFTCTDKETGTCPSNGVCVPLAVSECKEWCECDPWFTCTDQEATSCTTNGVCVPIADTSKFWLAGWGCLATPSWSSIYGNIICNSCPCGWGARINLDFKAPLRICDTIFPAIISPDWTEIFTKWKNFKIEKK